MARKLRVEYPGAIYLVMNRGDRRKRIFKDDEDRLVFLGALDEACAKTGWQIHALCLLPDYFQIVIETPQANLVAGMKWFSGTYTGRFNRRHRQFGPLFCGRYKTLVVDGRGGGYLKTVCDYVHLNPARDKMLGPRQKLSSFQWSTLRFYLQPRPQRPAWLRVDRLLDACGIRSDTKAGRREFGRQMDLRGAAKEAPAEFKSVRRGWYLGDKTFRRELLRQMKAKVRRHHAEAQAQAETDQAERLVRESLKRLGWKQADLEKRAKGDPEKVKLAARVRAETTVTLKWIAARLRMGAWTSLNHLLYLHQRETTG